MIPTIQLRYLAAFAIGVLCISCSDGATPVDETTLFSELESLTQEETRFLSPAEMSAVWQSAAVAPYFATISRSEARLKSRGKAGRSEAKVPPGEELRNVFAQSGKAFSEDEKRFLEQTISRIRQQPRDEFAGCNRGPWILAKTGPRTEAGLPHTQHSVILIPGKWLKLWMSMDGGNIQATHWLLHEYFHVLTRRFETQTAELLDGVFGARPVGRIVLDSETGMTFISNPDAVGNWAVPFGCEDLGVGHWMVPFNCSPQDVSVNGLASGIALQPYGVCISDTEVSRAPIHVATKEELIFLRQIPEFGIGLAAPVVSGTIEEVMAEQYAKAVVYAMFGVNVTIGSYPSEESGFRDRQLAEFCSASNSPSGSIPPPSAPN